MDTRQYRIESYLAPDEHFHFAHTTLTSDSPPHAHSHDFHEVFLVESGRVAHWINGTRQVLEPGTLVFMRPQDAHALWAEGEAPLRVVNVLFRSSTIAHLGQRYAEDFAGRFFWADGDLPAMVRLPAPRRERAVTCALELQTVHRSLARIEDFLMTLMLRVVELPETAAGRVPDWLVTACARAREPAYFRDGAAGFVRAAGRGHEHVCRKTKEHLGVTPSALVNRIRMEHAAHLLADAQMSVADVADSCGIENMSHFYRVFRAHYGVTPKAYRKQHQTSPF